MVILEKETWGKWPRENTSFDPSCTLLLADAYRHYLPTSCSAITAFQL